MAVPRAPTTLNRFYIYKHFDIPANGVPGAAGIGNSGLNYPLIHYVDVLLVYAEAQNLKSTLYFLARS